MKRMLMAVVLCVLAMSAEAALTTAQIEQFMTATKSVMEYGEKNFKDMPEEEDSVDFTNWSQSMKKVVEGSGHADAITDLVKKAGFSSLDQWADVSEQVMMAMFAALMTDQQKLMEAGMEMLESMAKNPNLSPEDRTQLEDQLKNAREALVRMKEVPAEDVATITPYMPQLQALFEGQGEEAEPVSP